MLFNAKAVIKCFLLGFILFLFSMKLQKKLETERNLSWLCIHFVLNFSRSVRRTRNCKKSCTDFVLDFSWSFRKNWKLEETFNGFFNAQAVIQHFLLTLILILTFHEASGKKWKKSLIAFQCQGRDKMFSSWIHFVLIFYEASEKNWKLKEIYHAFSMSRLW